MSTVQVDFTLSTSLDGVTANQVLDGTSTISATFNSLPVWVKSNDTLGLQVSAPSTGAPTGTFALQGSNDLSAQEGNNKPDVNLKNWSTLSFWDEATGAWVQSKAFAGAAASFMATIQVLSPRWLRLVWTNTSGTALLTVRVQSKSDGGR
jgi:hypothetical protein